MTSTAVDEGVEMLDVGGESRSRVDTSRPEVLREAVAAGAVMINDVRALRLPSALDTAAALAVPVCLMVLYDRVRSITNPKAEYRARRARGIPAGWVSRPCWPCQYSVRSRKSAAGCAAQNSGPDPAGGGFLRDGFGTVSQNSACLAVPAFRATRS